MDKKLQFNIWYFVIALLAILLLQSLWTRSQQVETIPYSAFLALLESGQVEDIIVTETAIRGTFKASQSDGATRFTTTRVDPDIAEDLARYGVEFKGEVPNTLVTGLLSWLVPVILFLGIWLFLFRRIADR
jgi:cell division protease FtsH